MPKNTKRLSVTLEACKVDAIMAAADDYGMSIAGFGGLCTWMGFKAVMRSIDPEKMLTTDQWVDIIEAAKNRGLVEEEELQKMVGRTNDM